MFGSVPRPIWRREFEPDEQNRIPIALWCLVLTSADRVVLVDCGMGDKWTEKQRRIYGIATASDPLPEALGELGIDTDDVTDVVLTHLHFDHAGGATRRDASGQVTLTYPRARHWVQRDNLRLARNPGPRERASYLADNVAPIANAADLRVVDGDTELFGGVRVRRTDGHTSALQVVSVGGDGAPRVVYPADLVPTAAHVRAAFTMGYDICPGRLVEEKVSILGEAAETDAIVVFAHDARNVAARVRREGDDFTVAEFSEL